jgi:hypothetical protein
MDHQYGRKLKSSSSARGNEFLGLTLPLDLTDFFMVGIKRVYKHALVLQKYFYQLEIDSSAIQISKYRF